MIHNRLINTDKTTVQAFYQNLEEKKLLVEIVWRKNKTPCAFEEANGALIHCDDKEILVLWPNSCLFRPELTDSEQALLQAARDVELVKDPRTSLVFIQVLFYMILICTVIVCRPEVTQFALVGAGVGLAGLIAYGTGCFFSSSRDIRLLLAVLLILCALPTLIMSILLIAAGKGLNRTAFYRYLYGDKSPVGN